MNRQAKKPKKTLPSAEEALDLRRQTSNYSESGKAAPNNNIFWEERSNPLSSKGN